MTDIYSEFRTRKCIMQEIEWQNLKCSNCGAEMPKYPQYDENQNEIKTCRECGKTVMLIRHIRNEVNNEFEPLRKEVEEYRKENDVLNKELKKLKRENEQLKLENEQLKTYLL